MATSSRRSSAAVLPVSSPFQCSPPPIMASSSNTSPFTSPTPTYYSSSHSHAFFNQPRSASPTRVTLHALSPLLPPPPYVSLSTDPFLPAAPSPLLPTATLSFRGLAPTVFPRERACAPPLPIQVRFAVLCIKTVSEAVLGITPFPTLPTG
ncbi:UNVERIFIED_CONTAM: hypothetical protein Sradi_5043600 [Sesamum radiatum]|uniref:Uncharacterized protein n=1 Tax=Sesamum radiatum TaxID=300843 RepID=A0AAW2MGE1_SESRA